MMKFNVGGRMFDFSSRTFIMGILNVTPDSFSDGGQFLDTDKAVARALEMVEEGADFIDIGGESTRPRGSVYGSGAADITAAEELDRVLPVIRALAGRVSVPISIDTTKADVAHEALAAGASIVNDISGFHFDPDMAEVAGSFGATAVVMHTPARPADISPHQHYDDLFGEIMSYLRESLALGHDHGVRQMIVDPGIGFGKSREENLRLIAGMHRFHELGWPVLAGPSRKSFIGTLLDLPPGDRLEGTLAAVTSCVLCGAHIVRVHDVRAARRATIIADAIKHASLHATDRSLR